jgi:hypothetical protein
MSQPLFSFLDETERRLMTVSQLITPFELLESRFASVFHGEISNLAPTIRALVLHTMIQTPNRAKPPSNQDSLQTHRWFTRSCTGKLTVYPPRGEYELVVETPIQSAPAPAIAFCNCDRLQAEGLFAKTVRLLPKLLVALVIVTSSLALHSRYAQRHFVGHKRRMSCFAGVCRATTPP